MSQVREFADYIAQELDKLAFKKTSSLISGSADAHDRTAGFIQGIEHAKTRILEAVKAFQTQGDENEPDGDRQPARRPDAPLFRDQPRGRRYG
jgi:prephenate dehydrogenase